ncbi:MAG: universal stress protein, partial [Gemmatimonadaceae bacterium]
SAATADPFFSEVLRTADDEYERLLPARFERMHALVSAPAGITLRDLTCRGDSAQELLHHAERLDADLIAVGRHGIGALERLILGSVASSVLRGAKCSVLVTPTPTGIERERLEIRVRAAAEFTSPETWAGMLARFTQRNRGRTTQLEEENPDLGTQTQEAGFAFAGAAYDAKDGRVELMFGDSAAARPHLTRAIAAAHLITVNTDERSMDTGLGIDHGRGRTFLRFTSAPGHRA